MPDDLVPSLSDEERMAAAAAHGACVLGAAGWGPLVVWLMYKDKSPYVAWRARQAMIVQGVALVAVIVIALVTCGFGSLLLLPWFGLEIWLAFEAHKGSRVGYPGLERFSDP